MSNYGWPGNVRELENAIERAVVLSRGPTIQVDDLPPELRDPQAGHGRQLTFSVGTPLEEVERRMIMETLKFTRGDKRLAADLLGIATRDHLPQARSPGSSATRATLRTARRPPVARSPRGRTSPTPPRT